MLYLYIMALHNLGFQNKVWSILCIEGLDFVIIYLLMFQICKTYFLLWSTKYILKNVGSQIIEIISSPADLKWWK